MKTLTESNPDFLNNRVKIKNNYPLSREIISQNKKPGYLILSIYSVIQILSCYFPLLIKTAEQLHIYKYINRF